jgi:hypothetical protein
MTAEPGWEPYTAADFVAFTDAELAALRLTPSDLARLEYVHPL